MTISAGYGSAELAGRLIQFATIFYLARTSSKADFGAFGFLLAVQQVVALLGISGIVEMLTGEIAHAKDSEERDRIIGTVHRYASGYRLAWFALSAAVIGALAVAGRAPYAPAVVLVSSASGAMLSKFNLESATCQIMQSQRMSIILRVLPLLLMNILGIIAYHLGGNRLLPFFLGTLAGLGVALAITRKRGPQKRRGGSPLSHRPAEIFRQTGPYIAVAVLGWLSGYGNNLIINGIFDAGTVAEYTLALTLAMPVFMLCNAMNQAWNPKFIELSRIWNKDDLNRANASASSLQLLLAALASLGLLSVYPLFFSFFGGNLREYSLAVPYAGQLMLGYIFLHLYYRVSIYYLVAREAKRFMLITTVSGLIGICLSVVLMVLLKTAGIYIGFVLANLITGLFFSHYAHGRWNVGWPVGNLGLVAVILAPLVYLSSVVRSAEVLLLCNAGGALALCAAWYGVNRKALRGGREALQS